MKKLLLTCFIFCNLVFLPLFAADDVVSFISYPCVSPDGQTVVFTYDKDLWKVGIDGGTAYRLTALDGRASLPVFSPDGRHIAFSASPDGNTNVFVMPADGGEITQLTFHEAADRIDSWSWDMQYIYFHSSRENMSAIYRISPKGGTPERLSKHYFNIPHHAVEHPHTGALIFTESWESLNQVQRKRYRGAHRPDLLSYHFEEDVFEQLTDFEGKDLWPTIDREGNIYFASDELNQEYNLYVLQDEEKLPLTNFDTSIGRPRVSANGEKIVFEKDYRLHVYDVASGEVDTPGIRLFHKNTLPLEKGFQVRDNISWFDVSPDNKKLAFVSRGELFVSDIDGNFVRHIVTNPRERVTEVVWAADNKTLYYFRTNDGWANLYSIAADGRGLEQMLEERQATSRLLVPNHDRTKAVYLSGREHVMLLDMESGDNNIVVTEQLWGIQNSIPRFSPDGRYLLFTAYRNFEQNILVHDLEADSTMWLTHTGMSERHPHWSPCGQYVYFASDRLQPNYPRGNTEDRLYRIPLSRFAPPSKTAAFDALFKDDEEEDNDDENETGDSDLHIVFDPEDLVDRWESIRVAGIGRHTMPNVFSHGDGQLVYFVSNHDKGQWALWKLEVKDFEDSRPERIDGASPGGSLRMVEAGSDLYLLAGGNIQKLGKGSGKMEAVSINHTFSRNLANEFSQIFYETWAALDENFYTDDFHGIDWPAMRDRYAAHLPFVGTRDDLRRLINDMLGELNASHTGFASFGEEERTFYSARSAETGLVFSADSPLVVERIIARSNLDLSELPVQPGDVLVAVNNRMVSESENRNRYFYFPDMPEELVLKFLRDGEEIEVVTRPHTYGQISNLYYDEWIRENRNYVAEKTDGRLAYVYMKNMSEGALNQFIIDISTHAMDKEGLIFDIRFNRGGNVHDDVLQFLSQRTYLTWRYRGTPDAPQPNFAPSDHPIVMLINERSLSDAEMTAEGFDALGLGTIIGTETYRWIIFTSGKMMVDGSFTRLPAWGCYSLDGDNLELRGVAPHIPVYNSFHDRQRGIDPQLDRAIEEALGR